jgi:hypothetical protein
MKKLLILALSFVALSYGFETSGYKLLERGKEEYMVVHLGSNVNVNYRVVCTACEAYILSNKGVAAFTNGSDFDYFHDYSSSFISKDLVVPAFAAPEDISFALRLHTGSPSIKKEKIYWELNIANQNATVAPELPGSTEVKALLITTIIVLGTGTILVIMLYLFLQALKRRREQGTYVDLEEEQAPIYNTSAAISAYTPAH